MEGVLESQSARAPTEDLKWNGLQQVHSYGAILGELRSSQTEEIWS